MTIFSYKKTILAGFIILFAVLAIVFRQDIIHWLQTIREIGLSRPFFVSFIIIFLKIITPSIGFPGTPLTLLSGSIFGNLWGTIVSIIGNTLGALLAFLLSRYLFSRYVYEKILPRYPRIMEFNEKIKRKGIATVAALRLIPLFPFNALNFLLGVTGIRTRDYFIGSFFGMIPGTFMFVYLGNSLTTFSFANVVIGLIGIGLLIVIGKKYEKRI
ncbi:MAG: TVP38/TMEM64 family protein [Candidatus Paceibacterota bacterium]